MTPEEEITRLKAENTALREQVEGLLARVQELEARLAKDSHNSSKPPSSNGLARKTRSLRRRRCKKPGGQLGHRGETLRLVAEPDVVVEHRPAVCTGCQALLDAAAVVGRERRQVQELPPLRLRITEHHALRVRCPACHAVTVGAFPLEAPSRAQYGPRAGARDLSGGAATATLRPGAGPVARCGGRRAGGRNTGGVGAGRSERFGASRSGDQGGAAARPSAAQ